MGHPLHSQPSQEYPIRALVRADALHYPANRLCRGDVIDVRKDDSHPKAGYVAWGPHDRDELFFLPDELILNPSPAQIAEERAKAGLPAEPSEGEKDLEPSAEASEGRGDAPQYRDLVAGEIIQEGDEVLAYGVGPWEAAECLGEVYSPDGSTNCRLHHRHRRPIQGAAEGEALPEAPAEGSPSLPSAPSQELESLLADYGMAFQQAGWDWRVKLDAAKAKIIEWVARSQAPSASSVPIGGVDITSLVDALEAAPIHLLGETLEAFLDRYKSWYRDVRRAALSKLESR